MKINATAKGCGCGKPFETINAMIEVCYNYWCIILYDQYQSSNIFQWKL